MKTIATINTFSPTHIKNALLPVLALTSKKDDIPSYTGALCVETNGDTLDFWVIGTGRYSIFCSTVAVHRDNPFPEEVKAAIRPSRLGLIVEHIKKAKKHLSITLGILQDEEGKPTEVALTITSEHGTITLTDNVFNIPIKQRLFNAFDSDPNHTSMPGAAVFNPKWCLPILNAFKDVEYMDIRYSPANLQMRVSTPKGTANVKLDALVCGVAVPKENEDTTE